MRSFLSAMCAVPFLGVACSAQAEQLRDPATGFTIDAPADYTLTQDKSEPQLFRVLVEKDSWKDFQCLFTVHDLSPNDVVPDGIREDLKKPLTLEETNKAAKEYLPSMKDLFSGTDFKNMTSGRYVVQNVEGYSFSYDEDTKGGTRHAYALIFITPTGRTMLTCLGLKSNLEKNKVDLEKILSYVHLPTRRLDGK